MPRLLPKQTYHSEFASIHLQMLNGSILVIPGSKQSQWMEQWKVIHKSIFALPFVLHRIIAACSTRVRELDLATRVLNIEQSNSQLAMSFALRYCSIETSMSSGIHSSSVSRSFCPSVVRCLLFGTSNVVFSTFVRIATQVAVMQPKTVPLKGLYGGSCPLHKI